MTNVTETEYELTFRTYTGVTVHFHVDRSSGQTRIVEFIPALDREEEAGSFDLFDYLDREVPTKDPAEPTPEPTEAPTAEPTRFVFKPKVCSVYLEEVFGKTMCETWFNLVDAVMAGEDTFACPDKHTYDWVMGQFPRLCFPVLVELIDFACDRSNPVKDGIGSFTWLVSKEEAAARIAEFAEQIEGILSEVLEDDWSDVEKALALYVYFSRTYEYDWDTYYQDLEAQVDYTDADFDRLNAALFPKGTDGLEVYRWTTDWSNYFDDGHEWWGTLCLTVYDKRMGRYAVILASATD